MTSIFINVKKEYKTDTKIAKTDESYIADLEDNSGIKDLIEIINNPNKKIYKIGKINKTKWFESITKSV